MKLLVFSDLHGDALALKNLEVKSKEVDIILCAGDFTIFSNDILKILKTMNSWKKPVFIIPGNHECSEEVQMLCLPYNNLHFINEMGYEMDNIFILGIEGNGFTYEDLYFEEISKRFISVINDRRKHFKSLNMPFHYILLNHAPPYNTNCDFLGDGMYCGNLSVRKFIEKTKPDLAVCGHIHETFNTIDNINNTVVINPGPKGRIITFFDSKIVFCD
jgi:uncharacterized protein